MHGYHFNRQIHMCGQFRYAFLLLMFLGASCSQPTSDSTVESAQGREITDSEISLTEFWLSFKAALKKKDEAAILRMTRLPLDGGLDGIDGFPGLNTEEGFKRHIWKVFPEDSIKALLSQAPKADEHGIVANSNRMESWTISYHATSHLENGDWTDSAMIYGFTRMEDGQIKLTLVTIAG
jgi:hypothetical protein